jgi:acyl-coenzyme A synthetase/AMP-(fatty) acid ligase/thioesterase domain-containing protein
MGPSTSASSRPSAVAAGVARWAAETPDRLAVCDQRRSISFGELDSLAGRLAARLADSPPGTRTDAPWLPILVERSVSDVIALSGAVRAGRAFAPIDSTLPRERVAELLGRLGNPTAAVLSNPALGALLPDGVEAIPVDGATSDRAAPLPVPSDAAGFVVFTSGSTGRPKAVVRTWESLETPVFREAATPGAQQARIGQLRPFSFAGGLNRLGTIAAGNSVHIADPSAIEVDALLEWLDAQQVTSVKLGPAVASTILRASRGARRLPSVTTIRLGGQVGGWELVGPLRALAAPTLTVVNSLGATEVGQVLRYEIGPDHPIGEGAIPLGHPLDPGRVRFEPTEGDHSVPQMLVADPAALGYLGDPELTAERFVTDDAGTTWWRSGDIVTVDDDGLYHHRGRVDDMVKINGLLVEPAEAEGALRSMPGIGNAAVVVHQTPSGASRLVAHVRVDDPSLTPEGVRSHLEDRLPKHLVPAMLVRHDELPINERGKTDRAALRSAEPIRWRTAPPRRSTTELERWVIGQVARILDLGEVGPDDDIWHLGLDSLGAVEMCAVAADAGFRDLAPTVLLQDRTAAALARRLTDSAPTQTSSAVVLNPAGSRTAVFAIPGGGGTALAFRALAQGLGDDQPLVVIEPNGMHQRGRVHRTVPALVEHARTEVEHRLEADEPCVILGYSAGGATAFELSRRLHASGRPVHLVLLDSTPDPGAKVSASAALPARLRRRTLLGHVRGLPTALRRRWLLLRPGNPSFTPLRYEVFQIILRRANADYQPVPVTFPATLAHVAGNQVAERCAPWLIDLDVREVGGDHHSMLEPPHVAELADLIVSVVERTHDRASESTRTTSARRGAWRQRRTSTTTRPRT